LRCIAHRYLFWFYRRFAYRSSDNHRFSVIIRSNHTNLELPKHDILSLSTQLLLAIEAINQSFLLNHQFTNDSAKLSKIELLLQLVTKLAMDENTQFLKVHLYRE
jgi:hypothetical protein